MYLYTKSAQKMKFSTINNFFLISIAIRNCVTSFCGRNDMSCTHQLWDKNSATPKEACVVKYFKVNSLECHLLGFEKNEISDIDFGNVILKSYVTEYYSQTLFEIHFSNITWHNAKIKISKNGKELQKNLCRTYAIWKNVTVPFNSKLMNNCSFSHSDYEGEDYVFEYELDKPFVYKKFVFKVPFFSNFTYSTPLNFHQVFSYVDVTNPELLTLHIQPISWKYNVSKYLVELFMEDYDNVSTLIVDRTLSSKSDLSEQLQFRQSVFEKSAKYYFSVAAISPKCNDHICSKTLTPKIFVQHHKNTWALASCVGVLFMVIILSVFFPGLIYMKKRRKSAKFQRRRESEEQPITIPPLPSENFEYDIQKLSL